MTSARPTTADSGNPPAKLFANATRSGLIPACSNANMEPVRPNPV